MALDIFQPSSSHVASVVVNTDLQSGTPCSLEVYLGPSVGTKTVTSGKVSFNTPAANTNSNPINCTVVMPASGSQLNEYIVLYDSSGNVLITWTSVNQALIFTGTITVTWA